MSSHGYMMLVDVEVEERVKFDGSLGSFAPPPVSAALFPLSNCSDVNISRSASQHQFTLCMKSFCQLVRAARLDKAFLRSTPLCSDHHHLRRYTQTLGRRLITTNPHPADMGKDKEGKSNFQLKVPKGTKDWDGRDMVIREKIFNTITEVFKRHGAVTIDTFVNLDIYPHKLLTDRSV
jgi:hypothetical protein